MQVGGGTEVRMMGNVDEKRQDGGKKRIQWEGREGRKRRKVDIDRREEQEEERKMGKTWIKGLKKGGSKGSK